MTDQPKPAQKLPFTQRLGLAPLPTPLAVGAMSENLWTDLFNTVLLTLRKCDETRGESLAQDIWMYFLHMSLDKIPRLPLRRVISITDVVAHVRDKTPATPDLQVYDLLEFLCSDEHIRSLRSDLQVLANQDFERNFASVKMIDGVVTPITDAQQREAIESAMRTPLLGVQTQLHKSLVLMSDRNNPDYSDSIKNSISAVETMCRKLTGNNKATLGQALKRLKDAGIQLHPSLQLAFGQLYGYTSDESGVRHAMMDEDHLELEDARYMLVACSAFISYLVVKADKAEVRL